MKKFLWVFLFLSGGLGFAQVPQINAGTVTLDHVGHATAHITYQMANGSSNPVQGRIRWIASPGTCTGGTGGNLQLNPIDPPAAEDSWWRIGAGASNVYSMPLHGLSPNTTYQVCPEVTADRTNWSSGVGVTLTTEPLPTSHPVLPKPVQQFDTTYPNTTGYLQVNITNDPDCSKLEAAYNYAISDGNLNLPGDTTSCHDQICRGVVINVQAGNSCVGQVYTHTLAPDAVVLTPNSSTFNTSSFIISSSTAVTEGEPLAFSATNSEVTYLNGYSPGLLPGAVTNGDAYTVDTDGNGFPSYQLPFSTNTPVFAHITCAGCDANHFQVYANAPYSAGLCPVGTTAPYSDNGNMYISGNACPILWQFNTTGSGAVLFAPLIQDSFGAYVRNLKQIIIRTSTPDSQFLPEHVRLQGPIDSQGEIPTPPTQWLSKMASLQSSINNFGQDLTAKRLFSIGGAKNGEQTDLFFTANVRFVGMELTYQPYPQAALSIDSPPGQMLIGLGMDSSNIIFDRCWIHGYPSPFRAYHAITFNGRNNAFVDSYIDGINFPRQFNKGLAVHQ